MRCSSTGAAGVLEQWRTRFPTPERGLQPLRRGTAAFSPARDTSTRCFSPISSCRMTSSGAPPCCMSSQGLTQKWGAASSCAADKQQGAKVLPPVVACEKTGQRWPPGDSGVLHGIAGSGTKRGCGGKSVPPVNGWDTQTPCRHSLSRGAVSHSPRLGNGCRLLPKVFGSPPWGT